MWAWVFCTQIPISHRVPTTLSAVWILACPTTHIPPTATTTPSHASSSKQATQPATPGAPAVKRCALPVGNKLLQCCCTGANICRVRVYRFALSSWVAELHGTKMGPDGKGTYPQQQWVQAVLYSTLRQGYLSKVIATQSCESAACALVYWHSSSCHCIAGWFNAVTI